MFLLAFMAAYVYFSHSHV